MESSGYEILKYPSRLYLYNNTNDFYAYTCQDITRRYTDNRDL
jgi:hypothetical protein